MAPESPQQKMERRAAQAQERALELTAGLERRRGQPAGPGDLFVLPATAELPVEWAILDRGAGGKLLAVPADSGLPAGTADFEIPAGAPGGPLNLRCRFGVWLDGSLFTPDHRSGVLTPETVAEARHCFQKVESGNSGGSPLREEVDADPEYVDWIRDVPERARELALAAQPSNVRRFLFRSWGAPHLLAAAFALVSAGLSIWVALLQGRIERLSAPIFNPPSGEVVLGGDVRGGAAIQVPRDASHIDLTLFVDSSIEPQEGSLEIVNRHGEPVWSSPPLRLTTGDLRLTLPREFLPYGDYRVRVFAEPRRGAPPLDEESLRIEPAE